MMYRTWYRLAFIFTLLTGLMVPVAASAELTGLMVEVTSTGSELLKFNGNASIAVTKTFTLANPDRVVVDIPRTSAAGVSLPKNYQGQLLKAVRFGQFDATTSRIVLDVKRPVKIVSTQDGQPLTLEIAAADGKAVLPEANAKPLIVIDAGHGGQDPGAIGLHKTHEKDITLNFARHLRDAFLNSGRYRVLLTRDDDRFITLPDRVAIARKAKGDIFISLHADSNPRPEARGLSIYTLSETASDDEAAALAERENKSDIIPGIDLNTTDADVASILIDLTQRETMNKSSRLADSVVERMSEKVTTLPKPHRFAGFRVLKAPDIPSVLVELGFLSNATDERLLLTRDYRDAVVASIVKGVDRYRAAE